MYHRAFLSVGAVLIAACTTPSEPEAGTPIAETPSASMVAASAVASATSALTSRLELAPPHAAIEDELARILPALEDQSIARELRPMLQEAQRLLGHKAPEAGARALDRLGTRLNEIAARQQDPDLAAVTLALEASR